MFLWCLFDATLGTRRCDDTRGACRPHGPPLRWIGEAGHRFDITLGIQTQVYFIMSVEMLIRIAYTHPKPSPDAVALGEPYA